MINNCYCCGTYPKDDNMISCANKTCPEFNKEYFVYDWQTQDKKGIDELVKLQDAVS